MLPTLNALIYDHDGTLVDSIEVVVAATKETLSAFGFAQPSAAEIIAGMVESTPIRLGRHAGITGDLRRAEMARHYDRVARRLAPQSRLYPGVAEMVRQLAIAKISQAVVSNSEGAFIRCILGHEELALLFECLVGVDDMPAPKPDPRGVRATLSRMGRAQREAAYVGDSLTDLQTARAAGILAIGVTWGTHSRAMLEPMGFDLLVDSPSELTHLLLPPPRL